MPQQVRQASSPLLRRTGHLRGRKLEHRFNAGAVHRVDEFVEGKRLCSMSSVMAALPGCRPKTR
jgi:hypothetical protein